MRRPPASLALMLLALGLGALAYWAASRGPRGDAFLPGYLEGDTLYIAASEAGLIQEMSAARGQRVAAGARLFSLDGRAAAARRGEAEAALAETRAQIQAAESALQQARAEAAAAAAVADNARAVAQRYGALQISDSRAIAAEDFDRAQAEARAAAARADAARRQAAVAEAQVATARASSRRAEAALSRIEVGVALLEGWAPADGRIEGVFFQPGEWAAANQPVVALLPDGQLKLRFFVPEAAVSAYRPGGEVEYSCDGCGPRRRARIVHVADRPEFTPPVIYSRESRQRLVFMVEARPESPSDLNPGQPVEVRPLAAGTPE